MMDLINDSDNMVRIKALESVAKLVHGEDGRESYLELDQIKNDILPSFMRLTESIYEDEDGVQQMS